MTPRAYFQNIFDNVTSIAIGMKITLKYCFQKTVTVQYPEQRLSIAPRYRGIHEFELEKCIACDMCAKACPVDCIYIDKTAPRKIDKQNLRTPIPLWMERNKDRIGWVKDEYDRVKSGKLATTAADIPNVK